MAGGARHLHGSGPLRRGRGGFTLVEVLIVVVLLAILAGAVAPRLAALGGRGPEAAAAALAAVLSAAASRDAMITKPIAIEFRDGRLRAMTMQRGPDGPAWASDRLLPLADISGIALSEVLVDGEPLDPEEWFLAFPQGERRPEVSMVVGSGGGAWRVTLASGAMRATARPASARVDSDADTQDLDALGRSEQPW